MINELKRRLTFSSEFEHYNSFCKQYGKEFISEFIPQKSVLRYFCENGPNIRLFEYIFIEDNNELFEQITKDDRWKDIFGHIKRISESEKEIECYIKFRRKNGLIKGIHSTENIVYFFDKNGPTRNLYDYLFGTEMFKTVFSDSEWKKYYNPNINEEGIVAFFLKHNILHSFMCKNEYLSYNESYFENDKPTIYLFNSILFDSGYFLKRDINHFETISLMKEMSKCLNIELDIIINYIEIYKHYEQTLSSIIYDVTKISLYFDKNGPTKKFYNSILFNSDDFWNIIGRGDEYKKHFNFSPAIEEYIKFVRLFWGYDMELFILNDIDDIDLYFSECGPKEIFFEKILLYSKQFKYVFLDSDVWMSFYHPPKTIKNYIDYCREINSYIPIDSINDIYRYFNESGPLLELYENNLFEYKMFGTLFIDNNSWKKYYNPSKIIKSYLTFCEDTSLNLLELFNIQNLDDISNYFNEGGPKDKLLLDLSKTDQFYELIFNENLGKYYKKMFTILIQGNIYNEKILEFINSDLVRGNYLVFFSIVKELDMDNNGNHLYDIPNTNKLFNIFNNNQMLEITKYCLFNEDKSFSILSDIIKDDKISLFGLIYNILFSRWDIGSFKKLLLYFYPNIKLAESILLFISEPNNYISDELIQKIKKIFIYGDSSVIGVINSVDDLNKYQEIVINENDSLIENCLDCNIIRKRIYSLLFNETSYALVLRKYHAKGDKLNSLINSINNLEQKEKLIYYQSILEFIDSLENEDSIEKLKRYLLIINKYYRENDNFFCQLWRSIDGIDKKINKSMGIEINEKITDFNELLSIAENKRNILYEVNEITLQDDFVYDNEEFKAGKKIPCIEFKGLPFVMLCHTLNAFGKGGKLSDFKKPRLIGKTHICFCALDDLYTKTIRSNDSGVDSVKLLFTNLPPSNFRAAAEYDLCSDSSINDLAIAINNIGNYRSIRKNIMEVWFHNEYLYFREGLIPSGVLVDSNTPNISEIQAAVYLNVPLIMINKKFYPSFNHKLNNLREKALIPFYKHMYNNRYKNKIVSDISNIDNEKTNFKNFIDSLNEELSKVKGK